MNLSRPPLTLGMEKNRNRDVQTNSTLKEVVGNFVSNYGGEPGDWGLGGRAVFLHTCEHCNCRDTCVLYAVPCLGMWIVTALKGTDYCGKNTKAWASSKHSEVNEEMTLWPMNSFNTKKTQEKSLHLYERTDKHWGNSQPRGDGPPLTGPEVKFMSHFWPVQLPCLHCVVCSSLWQT